VRDTLTVRYTAGEIALAEVVHEAGCGLQGVQGDECPAPPWCCAPDYMKATCLDGVRRAMAGETPEQHHQAWCDWKRRRHGWVYGDRKDEDAKPHPTHPCLVPYDQLPREQQVKDMVFLAIVRELAS
jgi:hypothetical protein